MSETVAANAGPDGSVKCTFDGEALELVGYSAAVLHLPLAKLYVKKKKKPEKDGGQTIYFVTPLLTSRVELYFQPTELPNMEALVDALHTAGVKDI